MPTIGVTHNLITFIALRAILLTVLYVRTLTNLPYFSPLIDYHKRMHFKVTACFFPVFYLYFILFEIMPISYI